MAVYKRGESVLFRDVAAKHLRPDTNLYGLACKGYSALSSVALSSLGCSITLLMLESRDDIHSDLEESLEHAVQFADGKQSIHDRDIAGTLCSNRNREGAFLVEPDGSMPLAGVELQLGTPRFKSKYGIPESLDIGEFLGYGEGCQVDLATRCALYSSDIYKASAAILVLDRSSQIGLFYRGDRVFSSKGLEVMWDRAVRLPPTRYNIVDISKAASCRRSGEEDEVPAAPAKRGVVQALF